MLELDGTNTTTPFCESKICGSWHPQKIKKAAENSCLFHGINEGIDCLVTLII
jgi:hypothetical protein